jgi:hypothetical protein
VRLAKVLALTNVDEAVMVSPVWFPQDMKIDSRLPRLGVAANSKKAVAEIRAILNFDRIDLLLP